LAYVHAEVVLLTAWVIETEAGAVIVKVAE
jgi:hypothetical protein